MKQEEIKSILKELKENIKRQIINILERAKISGLEYDRVIKIIEKLK